MFFGMPDCNIWTYFLSTIGVKWPDSRIWGHYTIKKRYTLCIVGFLGKLQVDHILYKLPEGFWAKATQRFWRGGHFLLANKEAFIFTLEMPRYKRNIRYTCPSLKSIQLDWRANSLPDNLAKVDALVEERLVCMLEILNHPSCYLFSQDAHEH